QISKPLPEDIDSLFELYDYARMTNKLMMKQFVVTKISNMVDNDSIFGIMRLIKYWKVDEVQLNEECEACLNEIPQIKLMNLILEIEERISRQEEEIQLLRIQNEEMKNLQQKITEKEMRIEILET